VRFAHANCDGNYSAIVSFCDTANDDGGNGGGNGNDDLNVDTWSASNVDSDSATLRGDIVDLNPNHDYTRYFEWGTSSDNLNHTTTVSGTTSDTGSFSKTISGLNDDDTYYFRACADDEDSSDHDCGTTRSFTTDSNNDNNDDDDNNDNDSISSNVITTDATGITTNSAILNGLVINESGSQTVWFEWGTTTSLGNTTSSRVVSGNENFVSTGLYGLSANQVYFFRLVSANGDHGDYKSFITNRIVSSGGTTTVIHHTDTVTHDENIGLGPLFLDVNLVADVKEAGPGDVVNFVASYENLTGYKLQSVKIVVDFDEGITIIKSDAGMRIGENDIQLDIPELAGHGKGEFHIQTQLDRRAAKKFVLVSTITGNHLNPTMANSWVDTVDYSAIKVISSRSTLGAGAFLAGFFPHTLMG
jgi:hypothetical protein